MKRYVTEKVEIFEEPNCSSGLAKLKDPVSGKYRIPVPLNQVWADKWLENSVKYVEKQLYMEKPNACEKDFELEWPSIWAKWEKGSKKDEELPEKFMAVLDTGYMTEHPLLQDSVEETVDFTGEGVEDQNGHGSVCALLTLRLTSRIPAKFRLRLLIVKVAGKDGRGSPENLIKGLQWLTRFKNERGLKENALSASLSLGVYSRNWSIFGCQGGCAVCSAAVEVAKQGIMIAAAAGNKSGVTACPARAGGMGKHKHVVAIGASDYESSGIGDLMTPTGHVGFAEFDM